MTTIRTLLALLCGAGIVASANGKEMELNTLQSLQWKHRLIIGTLPNDAAAKMFQQQMAPHHAGLRDRKLAVLLRIQSPAPGRWMLSGLDDKFSAGERLSKELDRLLQTQPLALIGLDGGVKARYELATFAWQQVFTEIDAMPMRQREWREP